MTKISLLYGVPPGTIAWQATILLVHGIDGDHKTTWQEHSAEEWMKELAEIVPGLAILTTDLDYSKWRDRGNAEKLIEDYANELREDIEKNSLFDRPTVIISHSLGGLLVKKLLLDTLLVDPERYFKQRRRMLKAIIFLGVPHNGSPWARRRTSWVARFKGSRSITSRDLRSGSRFLNEQKPRFFDGSTKFDNCELISVHESRLLWQDSRVYLLGPIVRFTGRIRG